MSYGPVEMEIDLRDEALHDKTVNTYDSIESWMNDCYSRFNFWEVTGDEWYATDEDDNVVGFYNVDLEFGELRK